MELVGGAAELGHHLAEIACEFGQLLRAEEEQGEYGEEDAVLETWHEALGTMIRLGVGGNKIGSDQPIVVEPIAESDRRRLLGDTCGADASDWVELTLMG